MGPKWASSLPSGSAQHCLRLELGCEVKSIVRLWTLAMICTVPKQQAACTVQIHFRSTATGCEPCMVSL